MTPLPDRSLEVPVLEARGVSKMFPLTRSLLGTVRESITAVDEVDCWVHRGETLGIVGESGSGKSTLARLMSMLIPPDGGTVRWNGDDVTSLSGRELRRRRAAIQMVFQDPYGSLDPTKTVGAAIAQPLVVHGRRSRSDALGDVGGLLERVGLDPRLAGRRPRELSGGQRQRVNIARALALEPAVLIGDEPTSALDLSTRAEILNLLLDLQRDSGQALVIVSHDFATIRHLSHRIAVMYRGRIVEEGPAETVVERPQHPYTQRLLEAVPVADVRVQRARRRRDPAEKKAPSSDPDGCRFVHRCPIATSECVEVRPELVVRTDGVAVACHAVPVQPAEVPLPTPAHPNERSS